MKQIVSIFAIIGMLIVLSTSALQAEEVDSENIVVHQIMLAELKSGDSGVNFIQSATPSSPVNVQLVASTDFVSVLCEMLTKNEMLSVLSQLQITTLIGQRGSIVMGQDGGSTLWEIELLSQCQESEIRTKVTLTCKKLQDGKVQQTHTIDTFHVHREGSTTLFCGQLGDENILFSIRTIKASSIETIQDMERKRRPTLSAAK